VDSGETKRNASMFLSSSNLKMLLFHYIVVFSKGKGLNNNRSRDWIKGDDDNV
jgi:hypothetical protein